MTTTCVKYLPFVGGGGGGNGPGADELEPPPHPPAAKAITKASGRIHRDEQREPGIALKVSAGAGLHPFTVNLLTADAVGVARAAELLHRGGVVAFPTETVYGLGAAALDARAVARIFEVKERPHFDPLIVHVLDRPMLERVVAAFPAAAQRLAERFWPGPLTLVMPKRPEVPDLTTAGLPSVAVRMPSHPVARALLAAFGAPVAAPSANAFGSLSPTRAEHIMAGLGERVDLILDDGPSEHGIESTVLAVEKTGLVLLRPGAIEAEAIEAIAGPLLREGEGAPVRSPGRLARHYSPRTPLRLIDPAFVPPDQRRSAGLLALDEPFAGYAASRVLSPRGDLREAAARFFDALHELDALRLERIDAQPLPQRGLGAAMMDRLSRAAAQRNA